MIRIVSDSTCDLSPELVERYHIHILPLCIELGEKEYLDGVNITPDEIYAWSDAHKTTPRTAAISFDMTEKLLRTFVEQGDEVLCFSISDDMSTTGNWKRLALILALVGLAEFFPSGGRGCAPDSAYWEGD